MRSLLITLSLASALAPVRGTTLERLPLGEMTQKSTAIVRAKVVGSSGVLRGADVFTVYQIEIVESWKGRPGAATVGGLPEGRRPDAATVGGLPEGRRPDAATVGGLPEGRRPDAATARGLPEGRRPDAIAVKGLPEGSGKSNPVQVAVPGGVAGGLRQMVAGAPSLHVGEEYVMFLWTSRSGLTQLMGLSQGLFNVKRSAAGDAAAMRAASGELMLDSSGHAVKDEAVSMKLSELKAQVNRALSGEK